MAEFPVWRDYVFGLVSQRLGDILEAVEEVAFGRMDERTAGYLASQLAPGSAPLLKTTHQSIAAELGTSREVISRILKDFEYKGYIRTARGSIEVLDKEGLARLGRNER